MSLFYAPINDDGSLGEYKELKSVKPIISQDVEHFWDNKEISGSFKIKIKYPKNIRKKYHSEKRREIEYIKYLQRRK